MYGSKWCTDDDDVAVYHTCLYFSVQGRCDQQPHQWGISVWLTKYMSRSYLKESVMSIKSFLATITCRFVLWWFNCNAVFFFTVLQKHLLPQCINILRIWRNEEIWHGHALDGFQKVYSGTFITHIHTYTLSYPAYSFSWRNLCLIKHIKRKGVFGVPMLYPRGTRQ